MDQESRELREETPRRGRHGLLIRLLLPWMLGGGLILAFFAPLLSPRAALASRDVPLFHLPLRTDLMRLAAEGLPAWNPWLYAGQPVLSNPNYAAFYPPTWLAWVVGPVYSLNLLVLLHAVLAFSGAWVLARRLGCGLAAASLAAVGFAGGGAFVSLTFAFNLFCGLAWLPWVLTAADRALTSGPVHRWLPAAFGCGAVLALQLLAGEPVSVLLSLLGLAGLAATTLGRPRAAVRLAVTLLAAAALAAVQLLPTWQRLADSPRSGPLRLEVASAWSSPPGRWVELVFPRFWGDASQVEEGLYFGWQLHDQGFPYLVVIYPGLLVTLLALASLARRPIPRRAAWIVTSLAGAALALGRYDPLYPWLHEHVPVLGLLRYPEKFLLAPLACLPFAAALGWQHLLAERRRGKAGVVDLPLALALAVAAAALGLGLLTVVRPALVEAFVLALSVPSPGPETLERGVAFLRTEALAAVLTAAAVVVLFALCRWRRVPETVVAVLAVVLLLGDLWHYGHRFQPTVPASMFGEAPALARELAGSGHRVFTEPASGSRPELVLRRGEPDRRRLSNALARLDPYSGNLWGIGYAFHRDYDLMLTRQAARNWRVVRQEWSEEERVLRLLGAWNIGSLIFRSALPQQLAAEAEGRRQPPARVRANPYLLPRYRFVPTVVLHPGAEEALAAARERGYDLYRADHWVSPSEAPARLGPSPKPNLTAVQDRGAVIEVRYRSEGTAHFVAAVTWDRGWTARVDGAQTPIRLTAIGQMGVEVPAGEHRLVFEYRDPWLLRGAAVTLTALLAGALLGLLSGLRSPRLRRRSETATISPAPRGRR